MLEDDSTLSPEVVPATQKKRKRTVPALLDNPAKTEQQRLNKKSTVFKKCYRDTYTGKGKNKITHQSLLKIDFKERITIYFNSILSSDFHPFYRSISNLIDTNTAKTLIDDLTSCIDVAKLRLTLCNCPLLQSDTQVLPLHDFIVGFVDRCLIQKGYDAHSGELSAVLEATRG
jgi:hypothetical protein